MRNSAANLYLDDTSQLIATLRVSSSVVIALDNCIPPNTDQSSGFKELMPELAQFSGDGDVLVCKTFIATLVRLSTWSSPRRKCMEVAGQISVQNFDAVL